MEVNKSIRVSTVQELVSTVDRYNYICTYLNKKQINFISQDFRSVFGRGKNIVVEINNNAKESILISAHYDDNGIYDNCGGVYQLLILSEKLSFWELSNFEYNYVIIFTDQEESFQQGIYHYVKNNIEFHFKYHLNIDGLGIGKELILYNSLKGHVVVDWLNKEEKVILLTDNSPFTAYNIDSFHLFSCNKSEAEELIITQKLHCGFQNYFNEDWCMLNFNVTHFLETYTDKILGLLLSIDSQYVKSRKFLSL